MCIYIYKVVAKHRICDFSIPQVTWNANKHRIWLDFMLDFKAILVEVNLVQGFIQNNRLELETGHLWGGTLRSRKKNNSLIER